MRSLLIFIALNTVCVYLVHQLLDGFVVEGGTLGYVLVGVVIGLLNAFVRPILKILSLPLIFLTAGLFLLVVNALILWIAQHVVEILDVGGIALRIDGMWYYIAAVFALGIFNYLFQKLLR